MTVRSGLGAGSADDLELGDLPAGAPVLPVKTQPHVRGRPLTGMVTLLPDPGANAYAADAFSDVHAPVPTRPSIENVCVRAPHAATGGTPTTTCWSVDCDARFTASQLG